MVDMGLVRVFADIGADGFDNRNMIARAVLGDTFQQVKRAHPNLQIGFGGLFVVAPNDAFRAEFFNGLGDAVGEVRFFGRAGAAFGLEGVHDKERQAEETAKRGDHANDGKDVPAHAFHANCLTK